MRLLVRPSKPKWGALRRLTASPVVMRASWQKLIDRVYWDAELETGLDPGRAWS